MTNTGKIEFLESQTLSGRRLRLPETMKYYNIIKHESLPNAQGPSRVTPIPYDIDYDYYRHHCPHPEAELVPIDTSAKELFIDSMERRKRKDRPTHNKSNSATCTESHKISLDLVNAFRKTERLPLHAITNRITEIKMGLSYPDSVIFDHKVLENRATYIQTLRNTFKERDIGNPPPIDCPNQLSREISRRLRLRYRGQ